jgi:hypothetical protein
VFQDGYADDGCEDAEGYVDMKIRSIQNAQKDDVSLILR